LESIVRAPAAVIMKPALLSAGSFDVKDANPNKQTIPPITKPSHGGLAMAFKSNINIPAAV
jgi:hypothetical protein